MLQISDALLGTIDPSEGEGIPAEGHFNGALLWDWSVRGWFTRRSVRLGHSKWMTWNLQTLRGGDGDVLGRKGNLPKRQNV